MSIGLCPSDPLLVGAGGATFAKHNDERTYMLIRVFPNSRIPPSIVTMTHPILQGRKSLADGGGMSPAHLQFIGNEAVFPHKK